LTQSDGRGKYSIIIVRNRFHKLREKRVALGPSTHFIIINQRSRNFVPYPPNIAPHAQKYPELMSQYIKVLRLAIPVLKTSHSFTLHNPLNIHFSNQHISPVILRSRNQRHRTSIQDNENDSLLSFAERDSDVSFRRHEQSRRGRTLISLISFFSATRGKQSMSLRLTWVRACCTSVEVLQH